MIEKKRWLLCFVLVYFGFGCFVVQAETLEESLKSNAPVMKLSGTSANEVVRIRARQHSDWNDWKIMSGSISKKGLGLTSKNNSIGGLSVLGSVSTPNEPDVLINPFRGDLTANGAILLAYNRTGKGAWCALSVSGYCHAGIFNKNVYINENSMAIRTSNTEQGMILETPRYWRHFEEIREMEVWTASAAQKAEAVKKSLTYKGKYGIGLKFMNVDWYCSKTVYRAYFDAAGIDLDQDGGLFVLPGDIRWSWQTRTLRVYSS